MNNACDILFKNNLEISDFIFKMITKIEQTVNSNFLHNKKVIANYHTLGAFFEKECNNLWEGV